MVDTKSFTELSHLAERLNAKSDSLNGCIINLNQQLAALNIGLEVWADAFPIEDTGLFIVQDRENPYFGKKARNISMLGYSKVHDEWQLSVKEVELVYAGLNDEAIIDGYSETPLLKASRAIRMKSARNFDHLVSSLKQKVKEMLENIAAAEQLATVKV